MRQPITFAVIFIIILSLVITGQPLANTTSNTKAKGKKVELPAGSEAAKALARLGDLSPATIREQLQQKRRPFYAPSQLLVNKTLELLALPVVNDQEVAQLKAALQPVLDYHQRSQTPIFVLRSERPEAHLVNCAIIVITTRLMEMASEQEIRGIVAHELGHEYVWNERAQAKEAKDEKLMREFELFCDAVAVFTMKELGDDPASLSRILERLALRNKVAGLAAGNTTRREAFTHPSIDERKKLIRFMCQEFD